MASNLELLSVMQINIAQQPLSPTLSRLRERELKPCSAAIMPSPAGGRGCATAWERGYLSGTKEAKRAK